MCVDRWHVNFNHLLSVWCFMSHPSRALWVIPPRAMRQELTALELFHWNTFSVSEFHHFLKLSKHSHWDRVESGLVLVCELLLFSLCFFFLLFSSRHGWDPVLGCSLTWSPWGRRYRTLARIIPLSRGLANVGQFPPDPSFKPGFKPASPPVTGG